MSCYLAGDDQGWLVQELVEAAGNIVSMRSLRRLLVCALILLGSQSSVIAMPGAPTHAELRDTLDRARQVSYQEHWHTAQAMLDDLAPHIDQAALREFVDFHLLEARHLVLGDRSPEALQRVAELLERPLDDDQRLRALQFSANVAVLLRDYETAFEYLLAALAMEGDLEDSPPVIATYNMASYMFGRVGEIDRAIEYGDMAIERALATDDPVEECVARQRLGPVYKWAELHSQAEAVYRQAMEVCRGIGNQLFVGVIKHGLADLLRSQGRLAEARDMAAESIRILTAADFSLGEFEARLVLAETLHDLGEAMSADDPSFAEMNSYFNQRELWDQAARLEKLLAAIAETNQDATSALAHYRRFLDARERFLSRDRTMRLAYLEVQFDTRLKEQQIELLSESARAAQIESLAARQQRQFRTTTMILAGLVMILLLLLLVYTFRSRRHFRHLSRHDSLTGLANHTWFFERASALLANHERLGLATFLVLADVDYFKSINDNHGHLVGDTVLRRTAEHLAQVFDGALVGRIGGEEFAILIVAGSIDQVTDRIERFRRGERADESAEPVVTVSFGISRARPGEDMALLRKRADRALYSAKHSGRDRWIFIDPDEDGRNKSGAVSEQG